MNYNYLISGYFVQSDCEISGLSLIAAPTQERPDVEIVTLEFVESEIPEKTVEGTRFTFQAIPGLYFSIYAGKRIEIYRGDRITDTEVNLFLLGSAWGVVCHQRGQYPLHCSSVSIGEQAFSFVADSGGGKSTLAASLCNDEIKHVCDDVAIINLDAAQGLSVYAMPKGLKLWREASDALGLERETLAYRGDEREKYYVAPPQGPDQDLIKLAGIYEIHFSDPGTQPSIEQLRGIEAVSTIFRNIYRVEWLDLLNMRERALMQTTSIAGRVPVFKFTRPRDLSTVRDSAAFLSNHLHSLRSTNT